MFVCVLLTQGSPLKKVVTFMEERTLQNVGGRRAYPYLIFL